MKVTIRLNEKDVKMLKELDAKMNIEQNYSAVLRLALQSLHQEFYKNENA